MPMHSLADILAGNADLQPKPSTAKVKRASALPKTKSARSQNRAAAWTAELTRWHAYHQWKAKDDAELVEVDAEYARRLEAGPEFTHYRSHSDYSVPPAHQLAADDRKAMLAAYDAVVDWLYANRSKHGQRISGHYRDVLRYLLNTAMRFGQVFPSYSRIAERCQCSRRTVASALAWLAFWGLLSWQRRIRRTAAGAVRQTTNAYRLMLQGLAAIGARIFGKSKCKSFPASVNPIIAVATTPLFAEAT